ncbi:hypothetical protein HS088_TW13G00919 [Tripterygium wilfordii]|uniref:J domain-containing protein n=1 Tax=Tripterygium wilfordii TaxID=458696 RepID=A0A7J7CVU8_TRIWF|nr:uncharacterized protein LOC120013684 [Tripterygium wilfordii]KAF5738026.1 hypothetical protein HS088_TW13G00919 [Tripterygium wilfordii]
MEQETRTPGSEPEIERFLRQAFQDLRFRDFSSARKYALQVPDFDPTRLEPAQIVAVADVMLAAERRFPNGSLDWYSVLQLDQVRLDSNTQTPMQTQFEKLSSLLNPKRNRFPFSQQAFKHVCDAWSVLSNRIKKAQYDHDIETYKQKTKSFWTVCPYCYYMYEYEKMYEECCLRCQICRRAFHGVAVQPPQNVLQEGEEYYCGFGKFPLAYKNGGFSEKENSVGGGDGVSMGDKKEDGSGGLKRNFENFVEFCDDDSDDNAGNEENKKGDAVKGMGENVEENVGLGKMGCNVQESGKTEVRNEGKMPMRRVKSVVRNSKKMMGRGIKRRIIESPDVLGGKEMHVGFGGAVEEDDH